MALGALLVYSGLKAVGVVSATAAEGSGGSDATAAGNSGGAKATLGSATQGKAA